MLKAAASSVSGTVEGTGPAEKGAGGRCSSGVCDLAQVVQKGLSKASRET